MSELEKNVIDTCAEHELHKSGNVVMWQSNCSECYKELNPVVKVDCELCNDTGIVSTTEWSGTDDSYEVEAKCKCQED